MGGKMENEKDVQKPQQEKKECIMICDPNDKLGKNTYTICENCAFGTTKNK